jgi:hypothetical protein
MYFTHSGSGETTLLIGVKRQEGGGKKGYISSQRITWCGYDVPGMILMQIYLYRIYSLLRGLNFEHLNLRGWKKWNI